MKKIFLILILFLSFGAYSQSHKNCNCCPKKTTKVYKKVVKKPIAKKPIAKIVPVTPVAPVTQVYSVSNLTINNTINFFPERRIIDTVVIEKPIIQIDKAPNYEVYTGVATRSSNQLGYMIGFNITPNLHQIGKNGYQREWFNKYLFGLEFSSFERNPQVFNIPSTTTDPIIIDVNCDCKETTFGGFSSGSNYSYNQDIKGISLNFGIEVYRGWFLTTGVTSYRNKLIMNNNIINTSYSTYIDGGVKKFIKVGSIYLSPMIKFNPEVTSFGIGFSYDKK